MNYPVNPKDRLREVRSPLYPKIATQARRDVDLEDHRTTQRLVRIRKA